MSEHRLMLFKLSQSLNKKICADLGQLYGLPAGFYDDIERNTPGLTLIKALEQRRIICEDANIMKKFHDNLVIVEAHTSAKILCDSYPQWNTGKMKTFYKYGRLYCTHFLSLQGLMSCLVTLIYLIT